MQRKCVLQALVVAGVSAILGEVCAQPPPEMVEVTGTVVDKRTNKPIPQIQVSFRPAEPASGRPTATLSATTNQEGAFRLKLPEGDYRVSVWSQNYRKFEQKCNVVVGIEPLRISLEPLLVIAGRILKPDQNPVANVNLQVFLRTVGRQQGWLDGPDRLWIMTDAEGRHRTPVQRGGKWRVSVIARSVGYGQQKVVEVEDKDLENIDFVLATGASISGLVRVKGKDEPMKGATVWLVRSDDWSTDSFPTNGRGEFSFTDLPPGRYELKTSAQNFMQQLRGIPLTLKEGQKVEGLVSELAPAVQVSGRILRPDGTPVANIEVPLRVTVETSPNSFTGGDGRNITTDAQGSFRSQVTAMGEGKASLRMPDVGFGSARFKVVEGQDTQNVEVRLRPFLSVKGLVREQKTGKPIAEATVQANYQGPWAGEESPQPQKATADKGGRFEVTGLIPGDYSINAQQTGYLLSSGDQVTLSPTRKTPETVAEMAKAFALRGQVVDKEGKPVANAKVWVGDPGGGQAQTTDAQGHFAFDRLSSVGIVQARAPGWATVSQNVQARPGDTAEVALVLRHKPGVVSGQVVHSDTRQPLATALVFAVKSFPTDLYGMNNLRHLDNLEGIPGFPGLWERPMDENNWPWSNLKNMRYSMTDAQGMFSIAGLSEAEYTLCVVGQGIRQTRHYGVLVQEGRHTEDLAVGAEPKRESDDPPLMPVTFSGRVLKPDGTAASEMKLEWRFALRAKNFSTTVPGSVGTDENGDFSFEFPRQGEGSYWGISEPIQYPAQVDLVFSVAGYKPAVLNGLTMGASQKIDNLNAKFEEGKPGAIAGRVLLPDGKTPAAGLYVTPFSKNRLLVSGKWGADEGDEVSTQTSGMGYYYTSERLVTTTDEQGAFRIENLWGGEYELLFSDRKERWGSTRPRSPADPLGKAAPTTKSAVTVKDSEETNLKVVVTPAGSISGTVVGEEGKPLAGASLSARLQDESVPSLLRGYGYYRSVSTDEQGRFQISGLAPGTYDLDASVAHDGSTSRRGIELKPGEAIKDLSLKLRKQGQANISGTVYLPDGKTPADGAAFLVFYPRLGYGQLVEAKEENGQFTLRKINTGRYKLAAVKPGYGSGQSVELHVKPDAEVKDVAITLTTPGVIRGQVFAEDGQTPARGVVVGSAMQSDTFSGFDLDSHNRGLTRIVSTDMDGRFELRDIAPGMHKVFVFAPRKTGESCRYSGDGTTFYGLIRCLRPGVEVKSGGVIENFRLQLRPATCSIAGTIARADGAPVANATVSLSGEIVTATQRASVTTDEQGRYTLENLAPGTYLVYAEAKDLAGLGVKDVTVDEAKPQSTIDLKLPVGGSITGSIKDKAGKPVENIWIGTVLNSRLPEHALTRRSDGSKEDGAFALKNLAPGEYELRITSEGYEEKTVKVVVKDGATSKVQVVLEEL